MQGKGWIYIALFGDYNTLLNPLPELADIDLICFNDTHKTWADAGKYANSVNLNLRGTNRLK